MSETSILNGQLLEKLNEYVSQHPVDRLHDWGQEINVDSFPRFSLASSSVAEIKNSSTTMDDNMYNLQGIKLTGDNDHLSAGIYIRGRRNFLVK